MTSSGGGGHVTSGHFGGGGHVAGSGVVVVGGGGHVTGCGVVVGGGNGGQVTGGGRGGQEEDGGVVAEALHFTHGAQTRPSLSTIRALFVFMQEYMSRALIPMFLMYTRAKEGKSAVYLSP